MLKKIMGIGLLSFIGLVYADRTTTVKVADLPQTGESAMIGVYSVPAGGDGNPAIGESWPSPRFVAGSGIEATCITDNLTGLMWAQNANLFGGTESWAGALTRVQLMNTSPLATGYNLCGHTDWRLPNKKELISLINYGYTDNSGSNQNNWLISQGFIGVLAAQYWSSSVYNQNNSSAWYTNESTGLTNTSQMSSSFYAVWPVRGGQ